MENETKELWACHMSLILALLYLLYGCVLLILGIIVEAVIQDYHAISTFSSVAPGIVITLALIMFAVGGTGLRGLYTEHIIVLKLFYYLSLVMILLELTTGVLCFSYGQLVARQFAANLNFTVSSYKIDASEVIGESVDKLQSRLECCGYNRFLEWKENPIYACEKDGYCHLPDSCCSSKDVPNCLYYPVTDSDPKVSYRGYAYGKGCLHAFQRWIADKIDIGGITSLVIASLQVVCCLALYWYLQYMDIRSIMYNF